MGNHLLLLYALAPDSLLKMANQWQCRSRDAFGDSGLIPIADVILVDHEAQFCYLTNQ